MTENHFIKIRSLWNLSWYSLQSNIYSKQCKMDDKRCFFTDANRVTDASRCWCSLMIVLTDRFILKEWVFFKLCVNYLTIYNKSAVGNFPAIRGHMTNRPMKKDKKREKRTKSVVQNVDIQSEDLK